jgi:hypothetical protein
VTSRPFDPRLTARTQIPGEDSIARARGIVDKYLAMAQTKLHNGGDAAPAEMRIALAMVTSIVRGADVLFPAREVALSKIAQVQVRSSPYMLAYTRTYKHSHTCTSTQ